MEASHGIHRFFDRGVVNDGDPFCRFCVASVGREVRLADLGFRGSEGIMGSSQGDFYFYGLLF